MSQFNYRPARKKPTRFHMKPTSLANLAAGVLARHRITRQVTAAMVIQSINRYIEDNVGEPLKYDLRALSYIDQVVRLACKNPTAAYAAKDFSEPIQNHLKAEFPDLAIVEVRFILNQDPWMEY